MRYITLLFFGMSISIFFWLGNSTGALPENTGAPGDETCGRSVCHNIPANTGSGNIALVVNENDSTYIVGDSLSISITLENSGTTRNGFQILALNGDEENIGKWILTQPDEMKIINGIGLPSRRYVTHTVEGVDQSSWTLDWGAPTEDAGDITFYISVLASNNNGNNMGDTLYTSSKTLAFQEAVATNEPIIDHENIVTLFPNPVNDILQIQNHQSESIQIALFDMTGRQLEMLDMDRLEGTLDLSPYPKGLYLLKFQLSDGFFSRRVIKQ